MYANGISTVVSMASKLFAHAADVAAALLLLLLLLLLAMLLVCLVGAFVIVMMRRRRRFRNVLAFVWNGTCFDMHGQLWLSKKPGPRAKVAACHNSSNIVAANCLFS